MFRVQGLGWNFKLQNERESVAESLQDRLKISEAVYVFENNHFGLSPKP